MNETEVIHTPTEFKDRSGLLLTIGILFIVSGCFSLFFGVLSAIIIISAQFSPTANSSIPHMLPLIMFQILSGVTALVLGGGNIGAKRWARKLSQVFLTTTAVVSLLFSLIVIIGTFFMINNPTGNLSTQPMQIVMFILMALVTLSHVFVPVIIFALMKNKSVKATCEKRNPKPSWTDNTPLSLILITLYCVLMATNPVWGAFNNWFASLFGILLTGFGGFLYYVAIAGLYIFAAWATSQKNIAGWWTLVGYIVFGVASTIVTSLTVNLDEILLLRGYDPNMIEQVSNNPYLANPLNMTIPTTVGAALFLIFLLVIRKHYVPSKEIA